MPYCSKCGVEVDEGIAYCPLCASPIQRFGESAPEPARGAYPQHIIDPENAYKLSKAERRHIAVEILSLAAALLSVALFLVDILLDAELGWSRYAVASVAFGWLVSVAPIALYGRTKTALAVIGTAVLAFILVLDALGGSLGWSLSLGIPIALTSYTAFAATAAIMARRPVKGLNLLGIGALGLAVYLVALESIIRLALGLSSRPYWSLVAAIALVPVAIFLFFLHDRVMRGANLRKIFRL
jgi:hypothetical protein